MADHDVVGESLAVRRKIGYLPEGVPLYPELRVEEYLTFRSRLRGIARKERSRAVGRSMERCGVAAVRRRIIGQLSKGYRQRVGLADVLLTEPEVLILDEPTAGLDPNQIREVRALIAELSPGRAVLLSSHMLAQVEAICSRVLILDRGRLCASGPVESLRAQRGMTRLELVFRGSTSALKPLIEAVEGVETVELKALEADVGQVRITGEIDDGLRERVSAVIFAAGFALRELSLVSAPLDDIFAALTGGVPDDPASDDEADEAAADDDGAPASKSEEA